MSSFAATASQRIPVAPEALPVAAWRTEVKVRFSHCDPAGIAYFASYFDLMNGVIEDWYPGALGLDYHQFIRERVGLGYAHVQCDFLRPCLMGDRLTFTVIVERVGRASIELRLHGHRGDEEAVRARLVIVTTSAIENRPIPVPPPLRDAVVRYQESCR